MDEIFKALGDKNRRRILDILRDEPGLNVNELSAKFTMSRYGIMKHLKILEGAKLVTSSREWKEKKLYLNAVPIQMIQERWIRGFAADWSQSMLKLKSEIEE